LEINLLGEDFPFLSLDVCRPGVIIQQLNIETNENPDVDIARDLTLLDQIERDPDISQATLANLLGVAVGTVNWHLKRLITKGAIKVKRAERKKLRYIITPEGLALRARLTVDYVEQSFSLYRLIRGRVSEVIPQIKAAGYSAVRLKAEGDIADVIRLTCLENSIAVQAEGDLPVLEAVGLKIFLYLPGEESK
jgi:DNA-binding MarR family transcriptional regulator